MDDFFPYWLLTDGYRHHLINGKPDSIKPERDDIDVQPHDEGVIISWSHYLESTVLSRTNAVDWKAIAIVLFTLLGVGAMYVALQVAGGRLNGVGPWLYVVLVGVASFFMFRKSYNYLVVAAHVHNGDLPLIAWELDISPTNWKSTCLQMFQKKVDEFDPRRIDALLISDQHRLIAHVGSKEVPLTTTLSVEAAVWLLDKLDKMRKAESSPDETDLTVSTGDV